jgi:hypothetical protein
MLPCSQSLSARSWGGARCAFAYSTSSLPELDRAELACASEQLTRAFATREGYGASCVARAEFTGGPGRQLWSTTRLTRMQSQYDTVLSLFLGRHAAY